MILPTFLRDVIPAQLQTGQILPAQGHTLYGAIPVRRTQRFPRTWSFSSLPYRQSRRMSVSQRFRTDRKLRSAVRCCWQLFASSEAHAQGKGAALAPGKGAEVGSVPIVHHGIGIL